VFVKRVARKGVPVSRYGFTLGFILLIIPTNSRVVQRFITIAGLLVFSVSAEAASRPPKNSVLVLYAERGDVSIIGAIEQNIREVFHASASPEIELFSEYCGCACVLLRSRIIYFPVLCP
jgi:hypothetical protein